MKTVILFLLVLLFLAGSCGVVFLLSQSSVPGDALYTVKIWSEDLRASLTPEPLSQLLLKMTYIERWFNEIDFFLDNGQQPHPAAAERLKTHLDQALKLSATQNDIGMQLMLEQMKQNLQAHQQNLLQRQTKSGVDVTPVLEIVLSRLQLVEMGLHDPLSFRSLVDPASITPSSTPTTSHTASLTPTITITPSGTPTRGPTFTPIQTTAAPPPAAPLEILPTQDELQPTPDPGVPPGIVPLEGTATIDPIAPPGIVPLEGTATVDPIAPPGIMPLEGIATVDPFALPDG